MEFKQKTPPREFDGAGNQIKDHGDIALDAYDQITFVTPSGKRTDFTALPWGFYLTNSLNARAKKEGFKTALVRNATGNLYLNLIEEDKIEEFTSYVDAQKSTILTWLDEG